MKKIEIEGVFGDLKKPIVITAPFGMGDVWQVFTANYYEGILVKRNGEWFGNLNSKSELTVDDVQILGAIIDKRYPST